MAHKLARLGASLVAQPHVRRGVRMHNDTIRVMLVDDHVMVREGFRVLLRCAPDVQVVGEASSGIAAVELARRMSPDVAVLDLDMPGSDGGFALREIARTMPDVRVLIVTMHAEDGRMLALLEDGACGYLTKDAASRDPIDAIRVVAAGEIYVRPSTARMLAAAVVPHRTMRSTRGSFQTLSEREKTVLRMVAQGFSGVEISRELAISTKTVDAYKRRVEEKLGLAHRTHYVRFAIDAGILGTSR
ncbi:MAG TPA: response regulator transcription factor [Gemmatimonadaceae bacterium]|nr:response regulator transcription factor [Gemmatimonadaceae bacterium]